MIGTLGPPIRHSGMEVQEQHRRSGRLRRRSLWCRPSKITNIGVVIYMSRTKLLLLSLLTVLAVGAVASASASAAALVFTCGQPGGSTWKFESQEKCYLGTPVVSNGTWEREDIATGTLVKGLALLSVLKSKLAGVTIEIHCPDAHLDGKLDPNGLMLGVIITYLGCVIQGSWAPKCEVASTLVTNKLMGTATSSGRQELTFEPEGTSNFIEIVIKTKSGQTCNIANTYPITGTQKCAIDTSEAEASEGKVLHEVICTAAGSKLKLGEETATYVGNAMVEMEGKTWAMIG